MSEGRESLHPWSLAMAIASLAAMAIWIALPDALSPRDMTVAYAAWTLAAFGTLFIRIRGHRRPADWVTALRVMLCVPLFAAHALDPRPEWWKVALAVAIIVLDGVDGAIARRRGPTEHGAVFDMEGDAFLIVTMCGIAHLYLGVSALVFIIAAMRPLYVLMLAILRLFTEPPSPNHAGSLRGRLIHVGLVIVLVVDLAPMFPLDVKNGGTVVAVALVCYSYVADILSQPSSPG